MLFTDTVEQALQHCVDKDKVASPAEEKRVKEKVMLGSGHETEEKVNPEAPKPVFLVNAH